MDAPRAQCEQLAAHRSQVRSGPTLHLSGMPTYRPSGFVTTPPLKRGDPLLSLMDDVLPMEWRHGRCYEAIRRYSYLPQVIFPILTLCICLNTLTTYSRE